MPVVESRTRGAIGSTMGCRRYAIGLCDEKRATDRRWCVPRNSGRAAPALTGQPARRLRIAGPSGCGCFVVGHVEEVSERALGVGAEQMHEVQVRTVQPHRAGTIGSCAESVEDSEALAQTDREQRDDQAGNPEGAPERQLVGDRADQEAADRRDDRRHRRVDDKHRRLVVGCGAELHERLQQGRVERDGETDRDQGHPGDEHGVVPRCPPHGQCHVRAEEQSHAQEPGEQDGPVGEAAPEPDDGPRHRRRAGVERPGEQPEHVSARVDVVRGRRKDAQSPRRRPPPRSSSRPDIGARAANT